MRLFTAVLSICAAGGIFALDIGLVRLSLKQQAFADELAKRSADLKKSNTEVVASPDGWLFFAPELRLLSIGKFWGDLAATVAPSRKPNEADPASAIVDFCNQLKKLGIGLVLVPVPPKAAIYPEKLVPAVDLRGEDPEPYLTRFYDELRGNGVEVVDLAQVFLQRRDAERGPIFCRTDTHWSGSGCVLAAEAIAAKIKLPSQPRHDYTADWKQIEFPGDLASLLPKGAPKPGPEKTLVRVINDKSGAPIKPDPDSPVLLMGDSHTLVYRDDFYGQGAGLLDQLASETGVVPDLIGTRGSGATTVRTDLYRRSRKDPGYLAKKKMIIWCFSAREFTESDSWSQIPVAK